jgi:hypothetical protein
MSAEVQAGRVIRLFLRLFLLLLAGLLGPGVVAAQLQHNLSSVLIDEIVRLEAGVGESRAFNPADFVDDVARIRAAALERYGPGEGIVNMAGAAESGAFRTWNQFQRGTAGQFASRAEAAKAWSVYKDANGIVTGSSRSMAARSEYLRSLADDWRTPSWQKPFLREGRVPPGYDVDHIKPLSIGGADVPANMRLQSTELHRIHHQFYDPWNW